MPAPSNTHTVEALVFACVVPAAAVAVAFLNPLLGLWVAAVSLAHGLVLAVPLYVLLKRLRWFNIISSVVAGFLIGAVPYAAVFQNTRGQYLAFAAFGAASGALFWLYIRWRPRNHSNSTPKA